MIKLSGTITLLGAFAASTLFAQQEDPALAEAAPESALAEEAPKPARSDVLGYWQMFDIGKKEPAGYIYIYEYKGVVFGRTVVTFDPKTREAATYINPKTKSEHLEGQPWLQGLDVMWGLRWNEKKQKYTGGRILDPRRKRPYHSSIWRDGAILKMFGSIGGPFGAAVKWREADLADVQSYCPLLTEPLEPKLYPPFSLEDYTEEEEEHDDSYYIEGKEIEDHEPTLDVEPAVH